MNIFAMWLQEHLEITYREFILIVVCTCNGTIFVGTEKHIVSFTLGFSIHGHKIIFWFTKDLIEKLKHIIICIFFF